MKRTLRKKIEELEAQLEKSRLEAPKGTEELAQGDDPVIVNYKYEVKQTGYSDAEYSRVFDTNWNEVFAALSPHMIDEAAESSLQWILAKYIEQQELAKLNKIHKNANQVRYFRVMDNDFQTIKVQLRALGLIRRNDRQRSVKDTHTYWTLTPYGDNVMTKLRAIKKTNEASTDAAS